MAGLSPSALSEGVRKFPVSTLKGRGGMGGEGGEGEGWGGGGWVARDMRWIASESTLISGIFLN